jgi:adenine-specific DNA-methyltransferase
MTQQHGKLELTWVGKDEKIHLEPRILVQDEALSYHAAKRVSEDDQFDNLLIHGDNLLALKALEQEYTGKVKCVFIDPPYNTGSAFEHYDDGVEHSIWLNLMKPRLELLRALLCREGSIWIAIDDNEAHYLKVLCDEVFERRNFIASVIWEKSDSPKMDSRLFSSRHDYVLCYAKDAEVFKLNRMDPNPEDATHYKKVDSNGRKYYTKPLRAMGSGDDTRDARPTLYFGIPTPDGGELFPKKQDGTDGRWRWKKERVLAEYGTLEWVKSDRGWSVYYRIFLDNAPARPLETIWRHDEVGSNRTSKAEVKAIVPEVTQFDTPKPERLLHRVISACTMPGDVVLDSFAGSGTTGAVAHKMGRRWIMVEMGDHCRTHIVPRLKRVVDGQDPGGVTDVCAWNGGGGFRYCTLGKSLMRKDNHGQWVIDTAAYDPERLAEAICKIEGFSYDPSPTEFWQHGRSTERDFIYVTTQSLTQVHMQSLSEHVGKDRSLLVLCASFSGKPEEFKNLTVRTLRKEIVGKYEWGRDSYALNIKSLPALDDAPDEVEEAGVDEADPAAPPEPVKRKRGRPPKQKPSGQQTIDGVTP